MDTDTTKWPAWFYGPSGQAQVFESKDDVPKGWVDHPSRVKEEKSKEEKPLDL